MCGTSMVKFASWDKKDGYVVHRDCYNSYTYLVEDESINILDRLQLHGKQFTQYLDGRINCLLHLFHFINGVVNLSRLTGKPKFNRIW